MKIFFLFFIICFATVEEYNMFYDKKDQAMDIKHDNLHKYFIYNIPYGQDTDTGFQFMLACYFKTNYDKDIVFGKDIPLDPSFQIIAVLDERMYSVTKIYETDATKLLIPIALFDGTLILTNKLSHLFNVDEYKTNGMNPLKDLICINGSYDKYYELRLESKDDISGLTYLDICKSSYKILKTLSHHRIPYTSQLFTNYIFYKNKKKLLNPIRKKLIHLLNNILTPKYHLLLKIKYMLYLIAEIQEKEINPSDFYFLEYDFIYLKDKYFNIREKCTLRRLKKNYYDHVFSYIQDICRKLNNCNINKYFFTDTSYENMKRILNDSYEIGGDDLENFYKIFKVKEKEINIDMKEDAHKASFYTPFVLYSELESYEGFEFLKTYSEVMYACHYFDLKVSLNEPQLDYYRIYEEMHKLKPIAFNDLIHSARAMPEKLFFRNLTEEININELTFRDFIKNDKFYYNWLENVRKKIYMNAAICGISFCDFDIDFLSYITNYFFKDLHDIKRDSKRCANNTIESVINSSDKTVYPTGYKYLSRRKDSEDVCSIS